MSRAKLLRRQISGGGPLVLDGATGTGLGAVQPEERPGGGLERLNLDEPDVVIAINRESLRAGAQVLRTNSFCASELELRRFGLPHQAEELSRRAAELARAAAISCDLDPLCLGVIGPGTASAGDAGEGGADPGRIRGLLAGGVDGILAETLPSLEAARRIVRAVRRASQEIPILASFSLTAEGDLPGGGGVDDLARLAEELDVDLLALNCAFGPAPMEAPLAALRAAWRGPLGAWPNAGLPEAFGGRPVWPVKPDPLAAWCRRAAESHDLRLVGGCCGTSAAHVAAIGRALDQSGGATRP